MTEKESVSPVSQARLERAWGCIVKEYLPKAKHDSLEKGEGISMFRFLKPRESEKYNCNYFYILRNSEAWGHLLRECPLSSAMLKAYRPGMFIVTVTVPVHECADDELTTLRLFSEEMREIELV